MKRYYTEEQLRGLLKVECRQSSQLQIAKEIGISPPSLSQMLNGARLSSRVVDFLGFECPRIFTPKEN